MHFSAGDFFPLESQSKKGEKSDFFLLFCCCEKSVDENWENFPWKKKKQFIKNPFEHLSLFTF